MGNPHATIFVDNVESFPVEPVARFLQTSAVFPEDVNVGFVERIDSRTAKIRVYERGAGETLACGTGTSAAMASGCLRGFLTIESNLQLVAAALPVLGADRRLRFI